MTRLDDIQVRFDLIDEGMRAQGAPVVKEEATMPTESTTLTQAQHMASRILAAADHLAHALEEVAMTSPTDGAKDPLLKEIHGCISEVSAYTGALKSKLKDLD